MSLALDIATCLNPPVLNRKEHMRVAALILGLILSFGLFIQSALVGVGESIDDSLNNREQESTGGAVGILVSLVYLVASALVLAKPRFSMWTFGAGAVLAVIGALSSDFTDLWFWAVVGGVLGLLSWRGSREKRMKDEEERAGREAIKQLAAQQAPLPKERGSVPE